MATDTKPAPATPVDCQIHNIPGYLCPCEGWICEHGLFTPDYLLKSYWGRNRSRIWYDVGGCPCGANLSESPDFLESLRSFQEKKSPDQSERRVSKKTPAEDNPGRWYMITFTQPDTEQSPLELLQRTMKVIKSKMVSPNQWCYSLELTAKGTPHTHIRLHTDKYFDYKKIGNFNAGYRYDVQVEKFSTANYVVKDESKPTPEWLASYGLDKFFWSSDNYSGPRLQPSGEQPSPGPVSVHLPDFISHV